MEAGGLPAVAVFFRVEDRNGPLAKELGQYFRGRKALWAARSFPLTFRPRPAAASRWDEHKARLAYLLSVIADRGGLGAKTQLGFGQIMMEKAESENAADNAETLRAAGELLLSPAPDASAGGKAFTVGPSRFFSITDVFTADTARWAALGEAPKGHEKAYLPCAPQIREALIDRIDGFPPGSFGAPGETSRVHVSHPFRADATKPQYQIRIWGDPEIAPAAAEEKIRTVLEDRHYIARRHPR
jgi:hypothetical protein